VLIRVNEDLDDVTIGVGNHYSFKMGQKYKVSKQIADHLEEKGYIWHLSQSPSGNIDRGIPTYRPPASATALPLARAPPLPDAPVLRRDH
jgi:hypothetical protein